MAGRGRGRGGKGAGNKVLMEQLGLQKSELIKEPLAGPPETFPSLQFRPVKVSEERSLDRAYMLVVKKELKEYLQNSEYNVVLDTRKPDIERYSDRFHCLNNKPRLAVSWNRFPRELRPRKAESVPKGEKRKAGKEEEEEVKRKKKKKKKLKEEVTNVKEKLEELEKKEQTSTGEGAADDKDDDDDEEGGAPVGEGELEGEDVDEEMDEGTDYINSYFDNGEDYLEEEGDALEEGGVF